MSSGLTSRPQPDPDCPSCVALSDRLDELEVQVTKLGPELTRLKDRKPKTSRMSSKPPSSDGPLVKRPRSKKATSGKQCGAQPGHPGTTRKPAAPEDVDVDEIKIVKPDVCCSCCEPLFGHDAKPLRHQITDIPSAVPTIVESQLHTLDCSGYSYINLDQRQACFAHLIRDFRRMAEGQRHLRWVGRALARADRGALSALASAHRRED